MFWLFFLLFRWPRPPPCVLTGTPARAMMPSVPWQVLTWANPTPLLVPLRCLAAVWAMVKPTPICYRPGGVAHVVSRPLGHFHTGAFMQRVQVDTATIDQDQAAILVVHHLANGRSPISSSA